MDSLPKDIVMEIAKNIDLGDLANFCATQKRTNQIVCQNRDFWLYFVSQLPQNVLAAIGDYRDLSVAQLRYLVLNSDRRVVPRELVNWLRVTLPLSQNGVELTPEISEWVASKMNDIYRALVRGSITQFNPVYTDENRVEYNSDFMNTIINPEYEYNNNPIKLVVDENFKLLKHVLVDGIEGIENLYAIMNEYTHVYGSCDEVELTRWDEWLKNILEIIFEDEELTVTETLGTFDRYVTKVRESGIDLEKYPSVVPTLNQEWWTSNFAGDALVGFIPMFGGRTRGLFF